MTIGDCPSVLEIERSLAGDGDPGVLAHLEACPRCRARAEDVRSNNAMLDRLASSDLSGSGAQDTGAGGIGAIPGYELMDEIQRGGQGIVYRALQRSTNRTVALKVLLAGAFATSRQRRRFEREIELVAGLEHPAIVTIYDSGRTAQGNHYFAMQLVEGEPLDRWIAARRADGGLSRDDVLALFLRICEGIRHAHQHGVIHRDLKPANILVDQHGQPHILDFGLARNVLEPEDAERATVTVAGEFMGTLAYAAPEQTRGDPNLVDVRSDVYTLGVILYEMLAGRPPYETDGDLSAVLRAVNETMPPPPSAETEPAVTDGLDDEIDTIVLTALAKDRERRYQSASAMGEDVRRYLAGEAILAKSDSGWYLFRKALARHRAPAAVAAAFVVLAVASSITMFVLYRQARTEAETVKQINIFLEDTLGSVEATEPGEDVTVRELLDEAVQWIDIALSDQPQVAASIRNTVANSYRHLGRFDDAETQIQRALETRRGLPGDHRTEVAQSLSVLALLRRDQGHLDEAERLFGESLDLRRASGDDFGTTIVLSNLGLIRLRRGDTEGARRSIEESLALRRRLFGNEHPDVAMCLFGLARVRAAEGDGAAAESLHRETLAIRKRVLHRQHPDLARSQFALGTLVLERGDAAEAISLLESCVELRRETLTKGHWRIAETESALGAALIAAGRGAEAEPMLRAAHADLERAFGADHELTVLTAERLRACR